MTIYALSTGPGISGVAIIRVSGPHSSKVIKSLTGKALPKARVATLCKINNIETSELIDEGILSNFQEINAKNLIESLRDKDWKKMRQWVVNNVDTDPQMIFRQIYDCLLYTSPSPRDRG